LKFETAIGYIGGDHSHIDPALLDRDVDTFVIDSREVKAGDVFFALSQPDYQRNGFNGDFDDATVFVEGAFKAGASFCVVRTDRFDEHADTLAAFKDRILLVDDAIAAFQRLAHGVYLEWGKPVVAVTGSAGKTTAKELTAHVLMSGGRKVLKNIKNYNNGLGHPLTVLNLAKDPSYDVAVLEMGMSTPMHEIAKLCRITPPDVAVELNVLPVHLEHLGTIENIAAAKAELVEGMRPGGTAVLNADDERVASMAKLSSGPVITYGIDSDANVRAVNIVTSGLGNVRFDLVIGGNTANVSFPLNGRHNIMNALAAASVGLSFGMTAVEIANALESVAAPPQRGEILRFKDGFTVINDSYNSNPDALLSMVRTLVDASNNEERIVVVAGEMLELGPETASIHRETGKKIAALGVDAVVGVRGSAEHLVNGAAEGGVGETRFAVDAAAAADLVADMIKPGDMVLVKGSRGVRTERVIERLTERFELEGNDAVSAGN